MGDAVRVVVGMPLSLFPWHDVCALGFCLYREILQGVARREGYNPESYYEPAVWEQATEAYHRGELFFAEGDMYVAPWTREILLPKFVRARNGDWRADVPEYIDDHVWGVLAYSQPFERMRVCRVHDVGALWLVKYQDWFNWVVTLPQNTIYDEPSGVISRIFFETTDGAVVSLAERALCYEYKVNEKPAPVLLSIEWKGIYPTHQDRIGAAVEMLHRGAATLKELRAERGHGICTVHRF